MIIGYGIFGHDNGGFLYPEGYGKGICEVLDFTQNRHKYLSSDFSFKKTNLSLSATYDSSLIVNQRFKDFCLKNSYEGIEFYTIPKYSGFYLLNVEKEIEFDSKRRKVKFEQFEKTCGKYNSVIGAAPICLTSSIPLSDGFYRTDIEFGTGYEQSPLIVIGTETYSKMQREKFTDIDYEPIQDSYDWED